MPPCCRKRNRLGARAVLGLVCEGRTDLQAFPEPKWPRSTAPWRWRATMAGTHLHTLCNAVRSHQCQLIRDPVPCIRYHNTHQSRWERVVVQALRVLSFVRGACPSRGWCWGRIARPCVLVRSVTPWDSWHLSTRDRAIALPILPKRDWRRKLKFPLIDFALPGVSLFAILHLSSSHKIHSQRSSRGAIEHSVRVSQRLWEVANDAQFLLYWCRGFHFFSENGSSFVRGACPSGYLSWGAHALLEAHQSLPRNTRWCSEVHLWGFDWPITYL